jgi:hypothetical protein
VRHAVPLDPDAEARLARFTDAGNMCAIWRHPTGIGEDSVAMRRDIAFVLESLAESRTEAARLRRTLARLQRRLTRVEASVHESTRPKTGRLLRVRLSDRTHD